MTMPRSTRRLAIVFGVLLVVTVVYSALERRATTSHTREFGHVKVEDITRIEVTGQDRQEVAMVREGDRWVVVEPVNWPADQTAVTTMLDKVAELSVTNLVSSNPDNYDRYEVGPDTGVLVRLLGGRDGDRRLMTFYVGAVTADINGTYIREFGSDDTWAASGLLRGYFNKKASAWRDKTIFAFDPASVTSLRVEGPDGSWTLHRRGSIANAPDAAWIVSSAEEVVPADSTRAASIVRTAATLRATDFPEGSSAEDADWSQVVEQAVLTLSDGRVASFSVTEVPGDTSRYFLRKEGEEQIFLIYKSTLDSVFRTFDQVKATG